MERKMKKVHPGQILYMELVEGRQLTISKIAILLATTRSNFSNIINGHVAISPNMALRIEKVFGGTNYEHQETACYPCSICKELMI